MIELAITLVGAAAYAAFCAALIALVLNIAVKPGTNLLPGEFWNSLNSKKETPDWLESPRRFVERAEALRLEVGAAMKEPPALIAAQWQRDSYQLAMGAALALIMLPGLISLLVGPQEGIVWGASAAGALVALGILSYRSKVTDLRRLGSRRQQAIVSDLAFALDGMVMMLDAGAALDESLEAYVNLAGAGKPVPLEFGDRRSRGTDTSIYAKLPPLQAELWLVLQEIRSGEGKERAFHNLAARCACMEVDRLVVAIQQSERIGTPLSQTLLSQANLLRIERSQRATTVAEQISQDSMVWVVFMGIIGLALLVAPALMMMGSGMGNMFGGK